MGNACAGHETDVDSTEVVSVPCSLGDVVFNDDQAHPEKYPPKARTTATKLEPIQEEDTAKEDELEKKTHRMEVTFKARDGTVHDIAFCQRPLGLEFEMRMPIIIKTLHRGGYAEQLGVQTGWQLTAVRGKDMTEMEFAPVYESIQAEVNLLKVVS